MAIGKPFTVQYARERVPAERETSPQFAKVNFVITSVWTLAFVCIVVTVLALVGAYRFTGWYPKRVTQPK